MKWDNRLLCLWYHNFFFVFNLLKSNLHFVCVCVEDVDLDTIESIETSTLRTIRQVRQDAPERLNKRHKHSPDRKLI